MRREIYENGMESFLGSEIYKHSKEGKMKIQKFKNSKFELQN